MKPKTADIVKKSYFITAIDTEIGKTVVTGLLAKQLYQEHPSVITMKVAQTGCEKYSEDIEQHRRLMGISRQAVDEQGLTCPYVFPFPASPHLSAALVDKRIEVDVIKDALAQLQRQYHRVLVEGVGGLMVPLNDEVLLIDLMQHLGLPVILVTSGQLGSINHTLLSLSALKQRQIPLHSVIFNHYSDSDAAISQSTQAYLKNYLKQHFPDAKWGDVLTHNDTPVLHYEGEL